MAAFKLTTNDLKPYFIPAGSHKAFPSTGKEVFKTKELKAFEIITTIVKDDNYPFDYKFKDKNGEVVIDPDIKDTHKLAGIHLNWNPLNNAKDTVLFGWRQLDATTLEFLPYINEDFKFSLGNGVTSIGNEIIRAYFERVGDDRKTWKITIKNDNTGEIAESVMTTRIEGYWWFGTKVRSLDTIWHGGQNDDKETPFGGVAPVPIKIGLGINFII